MKPPANNDPAALARAGKGRGSRHLRWLSDDVLHAVARRWISLEVA